MLVIMPRLKVAIDFIGGLMAWRCYKLVYKLNSPLNIGWRKMGNLLQTRKYVLGRTMWGAVTAKLTQELGEYNYKNIGEFVGDNLIFTNFYPALDPVFPLLPNLQDGKQYMGNIPSDEFDFQFLSSRASTAINIEVNAAEESQLYEVEYIVPETKDNNSRQVFFDWLFICKRA